VKSVYLIGLPDIRNPRKNMWKPRLGLPRNFSSDRACGNEKPGPYFPLDS
jgi:hypothetical protein